jgi:SAM-dependent methyltransferase
MAIKPFFKLYQADQLSAILSIGAQLKPFYTLAFVAAAKQSGLLDLLRNKPAEFAQLDKRFCKDDKAREALEAWLQLGIRLGLLELGPHGYALKGLAKKLAQPQNDAALALAQEAADLHYKLISGTLDKLRAGELWSLADQDGEVVARSSRILQAFQTVAIERTFPKTGAVRLLEIGCGSGFYIQYAAAHNPSLTALGLELQAEVAEMAGRNILEWGLGDRVKIDVCDIREKTADERFDIATLYNNIYYFPVETRVPLLSQISRFLKPGGFLLLTTCCQGGSLAAEILNLWGAATATGGRLPAKAEMVEQLREAGYRNVKAIRLIPGDAFFAFKAERDGAR